LLPGREINTLIKGGKEMVKKENQDIQNYQVSTSPISVNTIKDKKKQRNKETLVPPKKDQVNWIWNLLGKSH
jgi:hypothetical protein